MITGVKVLTVSALMGAAVLFSPASPAAAQVAVQDGLVNVAIGDVTIAEDVNIGVAANIAAQVCGVQVKNVAVLATQVDRSGGSRTVCETAQGPVRITQN
jgi:hypothetical protein